MLEKSANKNKNRRVRASFQTRPALIYLILNLFHLADSPCIYTVRFLESHRFYMGHGLFIEKLFIEPFFIEVFFIERRFIELLLFLYRTFFMK